MCFFLSVFQNLIITLSFQSHNTAYNLPRENTVRKGSMRIRPIEPLKTGNKQI